MFLIVHMDRRRASVAAFVFSFLKILSLFLSLSLSLSLSFSLSLSLSLSLFLFVFETFDLTTVIAGKMIQFSFFFLRIIMVIFIGKKDEFFLHIMIRSSEKRTTGFFLDFSHKKNVFDQCYIDKTKIN